MLRIWNGANRGVARGLERSLFLYVWKAIVLWDMYHENCFLNWYKRWYKRWYRRRYIGLAFPLGERPTQCTTFCTEKKGYKWWYKYATLYAFFWYKGRQQMDFFSARQRAESGQIGKPSGFPAIPKPLPACGARAIKTWNFFWFGSRAVPA